MGPILQDVRYAARGLAARPGFTLAALLTIALGVGASASIFSVVNGVLLKPLPYPAADELVLVWEVDERATPVERRNYVSVANYGDWRDENRVFEGIAAFSLWDVYLRTANETEQVMAGLVVPGFLETLGVEPVMGRRFLPDEGAESSEQDVALIGHELWQQRFGGDPEALGQPIAVNGSPRTVVGILPPGFDFLSRDVQVLLPYVFSAADFDNRLTHRLRVLARLRDGVSVDRAQDEMTLLANRIRNAHPEFMTGWDVNVAPLFGEVVGSVRPTLLLLLGAVGFVLLIATFNVASLLLGRATERQRELAVRSALGAGRGHLIRQLLAESVLLAVVGGGAGLLWAVVGTDALVALVPGDVPRLDEVVVDARVLAFGVGMSLLAGLACGLVPALQASGADLQGALKEGGRTGSGGRATRRLRWMLVVSELVFSVVLLIGAGLMIRTVGSLLDVDPGYRAENVLTTAVSLPRSRYDGPGEGVRFFDGLMERVSALPGVESVGVTRFLPFAEEWTFSFVIDGQPLPREGEKRDYGLHPVSTDYFRTMGITVVRGRSFTESDYDGPPVMMVNESMVRRFWPGQEPIGQRVKFGRDPAADEPWLEIVGIVADVRHQGLDLEPRPAVFTPYGHQDGPFWSNQMSLAIKTATPPAQLVPQVRALLREIDSDLILIETRTMAEAVAASMAQRRFAMILLGLFALAALMLASIGIYGVVSYTVQQRTQEMGIRLALGASQREILGLVVGQGMAPVAVGLALGLATALVATRFMTSLLHGVATTDPLTLAGVAFVLGTVGVVACYVPARRAARVDVVSSLRAE